MQILNAIDSIAPAIARTKLVLFTPFRAGRTWKLCATAYLNFCGTIFFPFPFIYLIFLPVLREENKMGLAAFLIAAVTVGTVLCVYGFYLCSRIQFAFFDIVLNRGEFVAPAWRRYGPQALRWTNLKILLGTLAMVAMISPAIAYVKQMAVLIKQMSTIKPGQPLPPEFMAGFFAGYAFLMLFFGAYFLIVATLDSFIVPSLALENVTMGEAFRRFGLFIRREPGQFLAYVALKAVLGIVAYFAIAIAFELVVVIVLLIVGLVVAFIGWVLHLMGVPMPVLIGLGMVVGSMFYLFIAGYGSMLALGPVLTFMQAYTLYFLGGRYPLLGDLLERSTPPQAPHSMPGYGYIPPSPPTVEAAAYPTYETVTPPERPDATLPPTDPESHS